jgi:RNA polymerase sigma-70 factor (ECF subfamily)
MIEVSDADSASFHTVRPRLFGIAYRVLGSATDADDVVQDAWIRWQATDRTQVRDATAFLVTATTRLAINVGQSACSRRETCGGPRPIEPVDTGPDPSAKAEQRDALRVAVRALLEKLSPIERAVYLLREAFDYPYRQIGDLLALSEVNARQLAARARRHLSAKHRRPVRAGEQQRLLDAFVAAAQTGDIAVLEHLLVADCADYALRVAA